MDQTQLLLQLIGQVLSDYGATVSFARTPPVHPEVRNVLCSTCVTEQAAALQAISDALQKDTPDFVCIEEILSILEPLGYATTPRHDF